MSGDDGILCCAVVCFFQRKCGEQHITSFTFNGLRLCAQQAIEWEWKKREKLELWMKKQPKMERMKSEVTSALNWIALELLFELFWGFFVLQSWAINGYLSSQASKMGWRSLGRTKNRIETESHCVALGFCVKLRFADRQNVFIYLMFRPNNRNKLRLNCTKIDFFCLRLKKSWFIN